jgi:hypothetical protein
MGKMFTSGLLAGVIAATIWMGAALWAGVETETVGMWALVFFVGATLLVTVIGGLIANSVRAAKSPWLLAAVVASLRTPARDRTLLAEQPAPQRTLTTASADLPVRCRPRVRARVRDALGCWGTSAWFGGWCP